MAKTPLKSEYNIYTKNYIRDINLLSLTPTDEGKFCTWLVGRIWQEKNVHRSRNLSEGSIINLAKQLHSDVWWYALQIVPGIISDFCRLSITC